MLAEYVAMAVVIIAWGGYPLVARSTGVGGPLGALVLTLSALMPILTAVLWQGSSWRLTQSQWLRLVFAGCLMGVGTTAFNFVVNSRKLDASISVPLVDMGLIVVSVIGAIWFFAEPLTARKVCGVCLLAAGIVVIRPS
jgi:drug/metabolite transporter (DMT)-like permease